jgi:hypothetical protein
LFPSQFFIPAIILELPVQKRLDCTLEYQLINPLPKPPSSSVITRSFFPSDIRILVISILPKICSHNPERGVCLIPTLSDF